MDFLDAEAREALKAAGAQTSPDTQRVRFDPDLVTETIKSALSTFTLHARNPDHDLQMGGDWMAFGTVGSPPNVSDLDRGRRIGNREDYQNLLRLGQALNTVHFLAGYPVEPVDVPWDSAPASRAPAPLEERTPSPEHAAPAAVPSQDAPVAAVATPSAAPASGREAPVAAAPVSAEPPGAAMAQEADDDSGNEDYDEVDVDAYAYLESMQPVDEHDLPSEPVVETQLSSATPATGLSAEWLELFPRLGLAGMTASIAANCTLVAVDGDRWHLHLDPGQSALFNASQQRRLTDALSSYHGRPLTLQIDIVRPEQETPAQAAARQRAERQREAEASIHADPLVRQMMDQFAAVIRGGTIEPLND